jgi:hypothetical protein
MRVAEFVAYERVQIHWQDKRNRAACFSVSAAMRAGRKLTETRLQLRTADSDGFG